MTLEVGKENNAAFLDKRSIEYYDFGFDRRFHEWPAATRDVTIGVKTVVSDRGILERTWYVAKAPIRERLLPKNSLGRAVVLFFRPELREPQEEFYHP